MLQKLVFVLFGVATFVACGGGSAATPSPQLDEGTYTTTGNRLFDELIVELSEFREILDIGAFDNNLWQDSAFESADKVDSIVSELKALNPPNDFKDFHQSVLIALEHVNRAAGLSRDYAKSSNSLAKAKTLKEEIFEEMEQAFANVEIASTIRPN